MAGELKHDLTALGTTLKRSDWEDVNIHILEGQTTDDLIYASSATQLSRLAVAASRIIGKKAAGGLGALTKAEILAILNVTEAADVTADNPPQVHGAAKHTDITRKIFLPSTDDYHASATVKSWASHSSIEVADAVLDIHVPHTMTVPTDFVSLVSVKAVWGAATAAGNLRWYLSAIYSADGEVRTTHSDYPAYGETANSGAAFINIQEPANPLTLANLAVGDVLGIGFVRDGAHANDTINASIWLLQIIFEYTASQ